ncbi:MAG: hypothetical protein QOJ26_626 [Thermoplasmata archaeon]|nr:hypothetical protein [Thermoplasmata archaeon]
MRIRIDTSGPYDLAVPILLAVGGIFAHVLVAGPWLSVPLGLPAVLFAPGYALLAFLFPRRVVVVRDGVERRPLSPLGWIATSIALSIALGALLGLILNLFDGGVSAGGFLTVNSVVVGAFCAGAIVRRANAPPEERFRIRLDWSFTMRGRPAHDVLLAVLLGLSALMVAGAVVYAAVAGEGEERFTEFYLLGSDGTASCLPNRFVAGHYDVQAPQDCPALGNVTVGIVNHEGRATHYWMRAVWTNETSGSVQEAQEWTTQEFTLAHVPLDLALGHDFKPQHEIGLTVPPPPDNGTWRLSFQLYREAPPRVQASEAFLATPYKRLHLFIQA